MAFEYRHATSADLQAIFQIEEAVMPTPWSMKSFQEAFDSDYSLIMVVTENGVICGFSVLYITAPEAELPDIVIDTKYQGKGLGKGLLEYTISEALKRNVETIFLEVRVSNIPARNLYQRFEFEEIGKRKYFYSNPIEDAICMSKSL